MIEFESSKIQPSMSIDQACGILQASEAEYQRRTMGKRLPIIRMRMVNSTTMVIEFAPEAVDVNNNSETPAAERHLRPVQEVP